MEGIRRRLLVRPQCPQGKKGSFEEQWMKVVDHKRVTDHTKEVNVSFCGASGCKIFLSI
jgi:hypothetical protein